MDLEDCRGAIWSVVYNSWARKGSDSPRDSDVRRTSSPCSQRVHALHTVFPPSNQVDGAWQFGSINKGTSRPCPALFLCCDWLRWLLYKSMVCHGCLRPYRNHRHEVIPVPVVLGRWMTIKSCTNNIFRYHRKKKKEKRNKRKKRKKKRKKKNNKNNELIKRKIGRWSQVQTRSSRLFRVIRAKCAVQLRWHRNRIWCGQTTSLTRRNRSIAAARNRSQAITPWQTVLDHASR